MESENLNTEEQDNTVEPEEQGSILHKVTPLSKYLAMILFIAMPFIGGWIGHSYVPEKVVEVKKTVFIEKEVEIEVEIEVEVSDITNEEVFVFEYSDQYVVFGNKVYWYTQPEDSYFSAHPELILLEMPQADPVTFEPKIVKKFDVSQGNTLQGWISRDINYVYYRDEIIVDADPATYIVGENVSVNYDKDHVFLWHEVIPNADPSTYTIIRDMSAAGRGTVYGKDSRACYKDYEEVECTDDHLN